MFEHSKQSLANKYLRGSVSIVSLDNEYQPSEIKAIYIHQSFFGQNVESVRVTFLDGLPECLYFSDFPNTCRSADRKIVAVYANGGYQK